MTTLRDPFASVHQRDIKNRKGEVVAQVDYVGWSQSADRLDDVHPDGWSFAVVAVGEDWAHGRLTIGDRHYENIGYAENAEAEWKKEVLKDAVSDAFKRCAALAGVARYLYDKDGPARLVEAPRRPQPAQPVDDPYEDLPNDWETETAYVAQAVRDTGEDACPDHNLRWTLKPAGTSKAGKPYDAFWKCDGRTNDEFCKAKPSRAWQARREG